jgi:hypothetical protein
MLWGICLATVHDPACCLRCHLSFCLLEWPPVTMSAVPGLPCL